MEKLSLQGNCTGSGGLGTLPLPLRLQLADLLLDHERLVLQVHGLGILVGNQPCFVLIVLSVAIQVSEVPVGLGLGSPAIGGLDVMRPNLQNSGWWRLRKMNHLQVTPSTSGPL